MNNDEAIRLAKQGNQHFAAGEFDLAIECYNKAIALDPEDAEAFYNRGLAYDKKGEFDLAIQDFDQAIALNPEDAKAFYNRGVAYNKKGEFDRAIEDFNQAIALNPEYAKAFYNRGLAYIDKGEFDRAIEDFDQAIALNPEDAKAFNNRGLAKRKIGQEKEAIQDFQEANKLDPTVISQKQVEEIEKKVKEVEDFQTILRELRDKYEKEECNWFWTSIVLVPVVFIGLLLLTLKFSNMSYTILYPLYIFLSIITFIVIRQYTNAKQLRIEASNRLAMAKMFEKIQQNKGDQHYQDFMPKIVESIAYSMYKNQNEWTVLYEELKSMIKNKS